jgi:hypothetical protein
MPQAAQEDLQAKFQNEVADAFAGRPEAADVAYQSVLAYYVGRAAELGKLAADAQTVDSALVREAVRATQGAVVDFNDQGSVLAPWGMNEDDFEDRIERAIATRTKELKIDEDTDGLGLLNANAEGQYALTVGRNLLLDKNGDPIVIDIKPRDPRDQRGYIERPK